MPQCGNAAGTRGMCPTHYQRWRASDARFDDPTYTPRGYGGVHLRLRRERGGASQFPCTAYGCDQPAADWAYMRTDPAEKYGERGGYVMPYSTDLSHYTPMCKVHHRILDRPFHITAADKQDMCRRYEAGETQKTIGDMHGCSAGYVHLVTTALGAVRHRTRDTRIREEYASGHTTFKQLGDREGLSAQQVGIICAGMPRWRRVYRTSTTEERREIASRRGEHARDLAAEYGYSESHIRLIWRGKLI